MTRDYRKFLRPEEISRISQLEVRARHIVEGFLSGLHRSPYFGQSIEFVQHREYVPGDDIRRIDWKAWSKTDKYYTKLYEEDTNLRTTLVVDLSESMSFQSGSMSKFDYGCTIAAALSYLLLRQQDSVGLVTFADGVKKQLPPSSQRNQLHAILASLAEQSPEKKTNIADILGRVTEFRARKGFVVVISDFFVDQQELFRGLQMLRTRGHDVMLFHVLDDQELDFDYQGTTQFEGMEETGELVCDPRALREGYLEAMQSFVDGLRTYCAKNMIDYQTIRTSEHLDAALSYYLNHRLGLGRSVRT
ncbi:hypothetical protein Pla110_14090 [Polystyrenella longa]|uniref:VWFA domain-containing protein n=1 Tax=Polystyrenella longa TaxID=2528007 RepID=A0A518CKD9_9PLAN|nr:hypothetical protein Pla110_14090 [Polystyrenella longa]